MTAGRWLLDFEVGGSVQRYSTEPFVVIDAAGRALVYRSGLADFTMKLDGLEEEIGLQVVDRSVNWALQVRRLVSPSRRPARLRFWVPGQLLEEARVVLDGFVFEPEYGAPGNPGRLAFSLRANTGQTLYPPISAAVDTATWTYASSPKYDPAIEGAVYPTVFGYPGHLVGVDGTEYTRMATPALLVQATTAPQGSAVLLSLGTVEAVGSDLQIYDPDGVDASGSIQTTKSDILEVQETTDLLSEKVSIGTTFLSTPGADDLTPVIGHRFYASWQPTAGFGGGIVRGDGVLIRDLPDVLIWALQKSGRADVDLVSQETARDRLGIFKVDGFINTRLLTTDWVEKELAPIFPIARVRSARGIYWRYLNWGATVQDAIDHLDADSGRAVRTSGDSQARKQVATRFSLEYAYVLDTGTYAARRFLGPDRQNVALLGGSATADERVTGSLICARSEADNGAIEARPIQTRFVWDNNTAALILQHIALRDAFPRLFVTYERPDLGHLRRGDIVTVDDAELGYSNAVAMVDAVELGSGRMHRVHLEVLGGTLRASV